MDIFAASLSTRFAKGLAACTKSRLEYLEKIGIIIPKTAETAKPTLERPWERDWVALQESDCSHATSEP